jgi:hypothetical protein
MIKRMKTKEEKKINRIYREIVEFCGAEMPFTPEQCEYIKASLKEAYLTGVIATLQEQLTKPSMKGTD